MLSRMPFKTVHNRLATASPTIRGHIFGDSYNEPINRRQLVKQGNGCAFYLGI
jgi:hypothetical protein